MYFHTDNPATLEWLSNVAATAKANGQSLRIDVDALGRVKVKRGGSVWTAPIESTPDPSRDARS